MELSSTAVILYVKGNESVTLVSYLKQGRKMKVFVLNRVGVEGLGSTPLPKLLLSAPLQANGDFKFFN